MGDRSLIPFHLICLEISLGLNMHEISMQITPHEGLPWFVILMFTILSNEFTVPPLASVFLTLDQTQARSTQYIYTKTEIQHGRPLSLVHSSISIISRHLITVPSGLSDDYYFTIILLAPIIRWCYILQYTVFSHRCISYPQQT